MAVTDIMKETTQQAILNELRSQANIMALLAQKYDLDEILRLVGASRTSLDTIIGAMIDGTNTTRLFKLWWPLAREQDEAQTTAVEQNRYATLCRWFRVIGKAWEDKVYTLRGPWWETNTTGDHVLTPMGDLAGKTAAVCATEETTDEFDWADEDPMTWYLRFNGLSLADGTMNVLAVEGVDDTFDITGNTAPVYTGQIALWKAWYQDGVYEYKSFATKQHAGMWPRAEDVAPDGTHRDMTWHSTFGGSLTDDNKLTSGVGNKLAINNSANAGITAARRWNAYEGTYGDWDADFLLDMFQLRHFDLENSGIIEGCLSYDLNYTVAVAETSVRSFVVTVAQGNNILIGSNMDVGTAARNGSIARGAVLSKENVEIDGTTYCRVTLDVDEDFTVTEGAHAASLPWIPGSTEALPGHKDGSLYSCTNGKTPARIAGIECIDGAYVVGLGTLWNSNYDANRDPKSMYTVYQCKDSEDQTGSITANYEEAGTFEFNGSGWSYIKHFEIRQDGGLVPEVVGGSSSTFFKSAFYFDADSGVRALWRFCGLYSGAHGGLSGAPGSAAPGGASWDGRPRLSGSGKKRGEWAA